MSTHSDQETSLEEVELENPEMDIPGIWAYSIFKGNFHFKDLKGRKPSFDVNDEAKGHDVQEITHMPLDPSANLPCGGRWPLLYYPQGVESAVEKLGGRNGIVITEERGAADGQRPERFHSLDEGEYYWTRWCNFACTILTEGPWRIIVRYKARANEVPDGEKIKVHLRHDDLGEVVEFEGGVAIKGCAKRSLHQTFKIHIGGLHLADRPHMLAGRVCFYFDCPTSE